MKQAHVYHKLRQAIYSGRLKPGAKLVERKLALEFDTSRVPLRESLLRLTSEGLVRRAHGKTSYVEDMTADDVREICLMRMALEPLATRLAAEQPHRRRVVLRLKAMVNRMVRRFEAGELVAASEIDLSFHREIVLASRSPRLIRAYETIHLPLVISRIPMDPKMSWKMREIHEEIVQQIELGDGPAAEQAARSHLEEITQRVMSGWTIASAAENESP